MKVTWCGKKSQLTVLFYYDNKKAQIATFNVENAVKFFKGFTKSLDNITDKIIRVEGDSYFGTFKWDVPRDILEKLRPIIAEELNYITGKKERPTKKKYEPEIAKEE